MSVLLASPDPTEGHTALSVNPTHLWECLWMEQFKLLFFQLLSPLSLEAGMIHGEGAFYFLY